MPTNSNKVSASKRRSLRISQKLPLAIVVAAVLSAAAVGTSNFLNAESAVRGEAEEKLLALMEVRRNALSDYLGSIQQDLRIVAANETAQMALSDLTTAWKQLGPNQTETLQRLYIDENPNPTGQKENLDFAPDGSAYSQSHARYHPWFRTFLRERGYYDIFLFDLDGNLVYTVFKELDYATNLNTGGYKDTDLGNAFRAARDNPEAGTQTFFDFKPYAPSHGAPASFISTPMRDPAGRLAGVLVFQMPIDNMNAIMQDSTGLGETGETFIVGSDQPDAQRFAVLRRVDHSAASRGDRSGPNGDRWQDRCAGGHGPSRRRGRCCLWQARVSWRPLGVGRRSKDP